MLNVPHVQSTLKPNIDRQGQRDKNRDIEMTTPTENKNKTKGKHEDKDKYKSSKLKTKGRANLACGKCETCTIRIETLPRQEL